MIRSWLAALAALACGACGDTSPAAPPDDAPPAQVLAAPATDHPAPYAGKPDSASTAAGDASARAAAGPPFGAGHEKPMNPVAGERPRVASRIDEFHLDSSEPPAARTQPNSRAPAPTVERRPIHIKLLSSPSGALAAVDGAVIGRTPAFWQGEFTGKPREFTFVLPGHAMARYRFVPTTNGVVHGTLVKIAVPPDEKRAAPPAATEPESPDTRPQAAP